MRSFATIVKRTAASVKNVRHINIALFGLILLLAGMAIGRTSVPQFVQEVWAAMIEGSGTIGTVPVFAVSGTAIEDSAITDNGSRIGIGRPADFTGGGGIITIAVDGNSAGITANKPLNIAGNSINLTGSINANNFSVNNGGTIALNRIMTISSNGINTSSGDFSIGASNADLILRGNQVRANTNIISAATISAKTLTAGIKNFVIDHPTKPGYELVHSSLEGPEIGVFYRGTAKLVNGRATIALPDYFDALTRDHTATLLLTAKGEKPFLLSYDRFDEKSFAVHGAKADGEFDWEVKATRQDVSPLEIERKKK